MLKNHIKGPSLETKFVVVMSKMYRIRYMFRKKNPLEVSSVQTRIDSLQSPPLYENRWNIKVVCHQETSAEKERQVMKSEAERDIKEAPPQSLAFSYRDKTERDFTLCFYHNWWLRFNWKILFAAGHRFYNAGHSWGNQWETDLGVVGMAGLGAPANLLGPHPVTLHWGIMYNGVKEQQQEQEKLLLKSHLNFNIQKLWTANDIFHKCTIANTHWASEFEWVGRAWCLIKTQL